MVLDEDQMVRVVQGAAAVDAMSKLAAKRAAKAAHKEAKHAWTVMHIAAGSGQLWIDRRGRPMRGNVPLPPMPKMKRPR